MVISRGVMKAYTLYKLKERDDLYSDSANYTPSIPWMYHLAAFKSGEINMPKLQISLQTLLVKSQEIHSTMGNTDLLELTRSILKNDFDKLNLENTKSEV